MLGFAKSSHDHHGVISEGLQKINFFDSNGNLKPTHVSSKPFFGITHSLKPLNFILDLAKSTLQLILVIWKLASSDKLIVLREFTSLVIPVYCLFPRSAKSRTLFFLNHNLSTPPRWVVCLLFNTRLTGLQYILFDGSNCRSRFTDSSKLFTPLFPISQASANINFKDHGFPCKIGIIIPQADTFFTSLVIKVVNDVALALASEKKITLLVGTARSSFSDVPLVLHSSIESVSTKTRSDYDEFMALISAYIFLRPSVCKDYLYRHSGTILDCVNSKVIPLFPDLPVIRSQVFEPLQIGYLYNPYCLSAASLLEVVYMALENIDFLRGNLDCYISARSKRQILFV